MRRTMASLPTRLIARSVLLALSLALGMAVVEIGQRTFQALFTEAHSSNQTAAEWRSQSADLRAGSLDEDGIATDGPTVAHPCMGLSYHRNGLPIKIGPRWRAATRAPLVFPAGTFVVRVAGGSVAADLGTNGSAQLLLEALAAASSVMTDW